MSFYMDFRERLYLRERKALVESQPEGCDVTAEMLQAGSDALYDAMHESFPSVAWNTEPLSKAMDIYVAMWRLRPSAGRSEATSEHSAPRADDPEKFL